MCLHAHIQSGLGDLVAYPVDTESWGDFMLNVYELIGTSYKLPVWSSRLEMLREVLQDLNDMVPQVCLPRCAYIQTCT
jgi:hypothetical protein